MDKQDWREKLAEAKSLFEQAKVTFGDDEASAEDKNNADQMVKDAIVLKREGLQLKEIEEQMDSFKDVEDATESPPETKQNPRSQQPKEFKDWSEYLQAIWRLKAHNVADDRLEYFSEKGGEGHEQKQMSGSSGSSGGFLIPGQFLTELQAVQAEEAIIRNYATVIRMTTRQVSIPVLDQTETTAGQPHWFGGMKFFWTEEGAEKEEAEAKFRSVNLVAKKLTGLTYATDELVQDSAISLGDFLSGPLGFAGGVVWMEDYACLQGVGGGQPRGIINAPCTVAVERNTADQINYVDAINMLESFLPSASGRWIVSQSGMSSLIQLSGPTGNPSFVWQTDAKEGVAARLFGMPLHWSEKVPGLGTRGDILLADPRFYIIGDRQATTIEASQFPRWVYDQTTWRVVHRMDGQPWLSAPLTYQDGETVVSPFVVLDSGTS